jgi:Tfp pilus assembly protein PilX
MTRKSQKGQALVLVLLSLSVVLTLVLFILSRSITDVAVSSKEEESARAFSAAEAGIERSLVVGSGNSSDIGDAHYVASVTSFALGG